MKKLLFPWFVSIFFLLNVLPSNSAYPSEKTYNIVYILDLQNKLITPAVADYCKRSIALAEKNKGIIIILLDTPGGLLESTKEIVKLLLNTSIPTVTYISPSGAEAASAGTFIAYATDFIVMSPSTNIGAAHPIVGEKWENLSQTLQNKLLSNTLAWAKSIAATKKHPQQFILDAVAKSISLTEKEAYQQGICDLIASDLNELINYLPNIFPVNPQDNLNIFWLNWSYREKILANLVNPNISYLLFMLGFLGLIFEFTHPGFGFPGIAGIICLLLSFYAFNILPLNYLAIGLLIVGFIFLTVELLTPSFGIFALPASICLFLGSIFLFKNSIFKVSLYIFLPTILFILLFCTFILSKAIKIRLAKPLTGKEKLIGEKGRSLTKIFNNGKVSVHGEIWNAQSDKPIDEDKEIIVLGVEGLILKVKEKEG